MMQLDVQHLYVRHRGGVLALEDVTFDLRPGLTGLLGPNGAGKSSLMRVLATLDRPSRGQVRWNGVDTARTPASLRRVLGYLPQTFGVYPNLTAEEFLQYLAALKGLTGRSARLRIEELLDLVNLTAARRQPLRGFSGGMTQRVGIAQALLNDPQVLLVDEPTVGLDPEERVRFRLLLQSLARDRIVLLSTHIVGDIEDSAQQVIVLYRGQLLAFGTPQSLVQRAQGQVWEWLTSVEALRGLRAAFPVSREVPKRGGVQVRVISTYRPHVAAVQVEPTLEDAYFVELAQARHPRERLANHVDVVASRPR